MSGLSGRAACVTTAQPRCPHSSGAATERQRSGRGPSPAWALGPVSDSCPGSVLPESSVGRTGPFQLHFAPKPNCTEPPPVRCGRWPWRGRQRAGRLAHEDACLLYPLVAGNGVGPTWSSAALGERSGTRGPAWARGGRGRVWARRWVARVLNAARGFSASALWPFLPPPPSSGCRGTAPQKGLSGAPVLGALFIHLALSRRLVCQYFSRPWERSCEQTRSIPASGSWCSHGAAVSREGGAREGGGCGAPN